MTRCEHIDASTDAVQETKACRCTWSPCLLVDCQLQINNLPNTRRTMWPADICSVVVSRGVSETSVDVMQPVSISSEVPESAASSVRICMPVQLIKSHAHKAHRARREKASRERSSTRHRSCRRFAPLYTFSLHILLTAQMYLSHIDALLRVALRLRCNAALEYVCSFK